MMGSRFQGTNRTEARHAAQDHTCNTCQTDFTSTSAAARALGLVIGPPDGTRFRQAARAALVGTLLAVSGAGACAAHAREEIGALAGAGGAIAPPDELTALPPAPAPDLASLVRSLDIPGDGSGAYLPPTAAERAAMAEIITAVLAGQSLAAATSATRIGYSLARIPESGGGGGRTLAVLAERPGPTFGARGTFVLDPAASSSASASFVVEVPHPLSDVGTLTEGVQLFLALRAGALFIAGAHRCAAPTLSPCTGGESTTTCGGTLRISDAAHDVTSHFQVAHAQVFGAWPNSAALSLHAHVGLPGDAELMVSQGTRDPLPEDGPTAPANRLRARLRADGFDVASCNARADVTPRLCGEGNVQGRLSNGSSDACLLDAPGTGSRFLHIEQGAATLADPTLIIAALARDL